MRDELFQPSPASKSSQPSVFQPVVTLGIVSGILFVLWLANGLFVPASLLSLSTQLQGIVTIFLGIFIEALPFLLAGVLASSAIHLFVSPEQIQRFSPRSPFLAALAGALLGLAFPVCECGSIPTTRRMLSKGAPLPLGIAFVLAAPVINPVVIISTWVAFGGRLDIVLGRIGLTALFAVIIALVLGRRAGPGILATAPAHGHDHEHHHHHHGPGEQGKLRSLLEHAVSEFFEMGRYLVIGALIAATLQIIIPREALLALGEGPFISALTLICLAFVLSICSTVDAFVALAFVNTFPTGALLAFLVFGPMVDIKSVLMFTTTFSRRTVILIVLLALFLSLGAGTLINIL